MMEGNIRGEEEARWRREGDVRSEEENLKAKDEGSIMLGKNGSAGESKTEQT